MLQTTVGILTGFGVYFIFTDLFKIPNIKTSKAFYNLSKRQKRKRQALNSGCKALRSLLQGI